MICFLVFLIAIPFGRYAGGEDPRVFKPTTPTFRMREDGEWAGTIVAALFRLRFAFILVFLSRR